MRNSVKKSDEERAMSVERHRMLQERSVIGCCLLDARAIDTASGIVRPEHFRWDVHGIVFRALVDMRNNGHSGIDIGTVADELLNRGQLEDIGGPIFLTECLEAVPYSDHVEHYAESVRGDWQFREVKTVGETLVGYVNSGETIDEVLMRSERKIHDAMEASVKSEVESVGQIFAAAIDSGFKKRGGLMTGFGEFDLMTGGLQPGQLIVLGGRPGMGKSAIALNMAQNICEAGGAALFVSLEMPRLDLTVRMLSRATGLTRKDINSGDGKNNVKICEAAKHLGILKLMISDTVGQNAVQVSAMTRLMKRKHKIGVVIIDYLQLIETEDRRANREQQIAQISRRMKLLARSSELPVILLTQLNRESEKRNTKRPQMCDIRESGAVEQDADIVLLIHRPGYYDATVDQKTAELIVAKHRNGETGIVAMEWFPQTSTFRGKELHAPANF